MRHILREWAGTALAWPRQLPLGPAGWAGTPRAVPLGMITICNGWKTYHRSVVVTPEDGINEGHVNHGMCALCAADAEEAMVAEAAFRNDPAYLAYLDNHLFDPRG